MKKLTLILAAVLICAANLFAVNKGVEDTSLVRISTPEMRAAFLTQKMKEKLNLDAELPKIEEINLRYETQLQELTIENPAPIHRTAAKKGSDKFDALSAAREKEVKKALKSSQYKLYEKNRWGFRSALKTQMIADKEARDREERERVAREKAAREKATADSIANVYLKAIGAKTTKGATGSKGKADPAKKAKKKKKK
jgi:hypothetical protein